MSRDDLDQHSARANAIIAQAHEIGFDDAAFTSANAPAVWGTQLEEFLAQGRHGSMAWLATRTAERAAPQALWPQARSVLMLAMNYGPAHDPLSILAQHNNGAISVYAQNKDYHDVIKKRLKRLARWMIDEYGGTLKIFVDTAPVMEKPLAHKAGLGWQGKHTNLVSRRFGSWLFLASIFTTLEAPAASPQTDHCGQCRQCLDACPTNAFPAPYQLDARRCISYLTIEHDGPIPVEFRTQMGNRIYGCDDCLAVCPWNKFAQDATEAAYWARDALKAPTLADLVALDDTGFRTLFSGSPVKRIKHHRFLRNVLIACGNSHNEELIPLVKQRLSDPHPLIRGSAVWALSHLLTENEFKHLRTQYSAKEDDNTVLWEWQHSLSENPS